MFKIKRLKDILLHLIYFNFFKKKLGIGEMEMGRGVTIWEMNPHQQGGGSGSQPTKLLRLSYIF